MPSAQKLFKESSLKKVVRLLMNKDAKKFIEIVKRMNTQQKFCEVVQQILRMILIGNMDCEKLLQDFEQNH